MLHIEESFQIKKQQPDGHSKDAETIHIVEAFSRQF